MWPDRAKGLLKWFPPFMIEKIFVKITEVRWIQLHYPITWEFENGGFTLKTHQMFSVHTTLGKFKSATITVYFGFLFEENSDREITWLTELHRFWKAPFSKRFPSKRKCKAGVFKFLRREERFGKALFSRRTMVDGRPNSRNQAAFSNSFGVV